jgi:TolB-like protein
MNTVDREAWNELHRKYKEWLTSASTEDVINLLSRSETNIVVEKNARVLSGKYKGRLQKDMAVE